METEDSFSNWELIEEIGSGGNGEVWRAKRAGAECALKVLRKTNSDDESYRRFVSEIDILRKLENHPGVLPILDAHLPMIPSKRNKAWLSMPIAIAIKKALGDRPRIEQVVTAMASVAESLSMLAAEDICHRDIKPENLYYYNDQWMIGDFGLADFPGKDDITQEGRALGPRFYIAPEMVRDPIHASGFPADVWSLAKTMWVLATGQNYPPPHPQPANDSRDALGVLVNHARAFHLDNLIEQATDIDPAARPTMRGFADELKAWLALADTPTPVTDVSNVTNRIRLLSGQFFDRQSRLERCREEAVMMTTRLLLDLQGVSENLKVTGLPHNGPASNGGNLFEGSGLSRSEYGTHGVTVTERLR